MGKQKQQVISRFFAPKPKPSNPSSSSLSQSPPPYPPVPRVPPVQPSPSSPKISATVTFSPANKRLIVSSSSSSPKPPKIPKLEYPPPSLHQRFLQRLLEPIDPDPTGKTPQSPPPPPSSSSSKYTPLEQQVLDLKKSHPDVLLMIEVGYKYRFFGDDAEKAARELGIYAHVDRNFLTASVPTFRLGVHVRRLVAAGHKVGVVRQTETAAIKAHGPNKSAPFGRGLSALYTRATLEAAAEAEELAGDGWGGDSNYLVCVVEEGEEESGTVRIGVVGVEISTGDVVFGDFKDGVLRSGVEALLVGLTPAEILLGLPLSKLTQKVLVGYAGPASHVRLERTSRECLVGGGALAEVMTLYENLEGNNQLAVKVIMDMPDLVVQALALTIRYLKQFGLERVLCLGASFRPFSSNFEMTLSVNTLQQLEVLRNNCEGSESGSLFQTMNHTITAFGSRLLRHWVTHPLSNRDMIIARLDAVSEICESMGSFHPPRDKEDAVVNLKSNVNHVLSSVLTSLGRAPDIQRGIMRIFHRTASPIEFVAVVQAILDAGKQLQQVHTEEQEFEEESAENSTPSTLKSELLRKLISTASSSSVIRSAAQLLSSVSKEAADKRDLQNLLVCDGQYPEVATARKELQLAEEKLDSLISMYRKQLRMSKLEFTNVSGSTHLIELSLDVKVPSDWVKVNSTKKSIRYHPPEVLSALNKLSLAKEELNIICQSAWNSFLGEFSKYYAGFQAAVEALATLDSLHSLAILSRNSNYVRPVFVLDDEPTQIHISAGRHPVLERLLQDNFVPNDTDLHAEREYCQIVTGPNMGGKSCYIRQVALIAIMAHVGSFVPAASAKLHVLDKIYTRIGASDSIQQGISTFLEELSEASHILQNCSNRSLVIIDELGRGTSTHDGFAIAFATLHHLLERKRSAVLFVTHYPKISDIVPEFPGSARAYRVSYLAKSEHSSRDVTYLYKLVPGVSEKSFGLKVAELAQLPASCVSRASVMAMKLETLVNNKVGNKFELTDLKEENKLMSNVEVEMSKAYEEFFSNIKAALSAETREMSFRLLNRARGLAQELINNMKI